MENINVQVYSLVSEPISPIEKLQTISKLGFAGAEFTADFTEVPVEEMKKVLAENNLKVDSAHVGLDQIESVLPYFAELGAKLVICPMTNFCNKAEAEEVAAELNRLGNIAKQYGIKIGYHNHSQEFFMDEGKTLLEHLLDNSTKCYSQLDCGWAQNGGCYPPSFIRRYKNRFVAIHVKENSKVQGPGPRPASRHAAEEAGHANPFANVKEMPLEERQKILDGFNAHMNSPEGKKRFEVQCPMGAPASNMNWQDIKDALDEQDFEAFWVVEREGFYDEHDKCIADDARWIKENIH